MFELVGIGELERSTRRRTGEHDEPEQDAHNRESPGGTLSQKECVS